MNIEEKLIESFKGLAMEKPVEKITIKDITDGAGVIRTTFYNHFQDKYDLIEQILKEEIIDPVGPLLENDMIDETILLIFKNLEKNRPFYRRLARLEGGQTGFDQIVQRQVQARLKSYMEERISPEGYEIMKSKFHWLSLDLVAEYYAQNITFVAMTWVRSGMDITPEDATSVFNMILTLSLKDLTTLMASNTEEGMQYLKG